MTATPVVQSRLGTFSPAAGLGTLTESFRIHEKARSSLIDGNSRQETLEDILGKAENQDGDAILADDAANMMHRRLSDQMEDSEEEELVSAYELFKGPRPPIAFKPKRNS